MNQFYIYHITIVSIIFKVYQYIEWCELFDNTYSSLALISRGIITISSSQKQKKIYELDYRDTLSCPKTQKGSEQIISCYCKKLFIKCHRYVSGLCSTHQTIKCTGEYHGVFPVSCTDIDDYEHF